MKKILYSAMIITLMFGICSANTNTDKSYKYVNDQNYDFETNISDEQLRDLENMDKIDDDNAGFWHKIINSSHFSSGTATRTWIPINKQK